MAVAVATTTATARAGRWQRGVGNEIYVREIEMERGRFRVREIEKRGENFREMGDFPVF